MTDRKKKRIGIFVIAYNAVNKLDWTLDRIPQEVWDKVDEVFLFDDCSTDNTYYAAIGYKHAKKPQNPKVLAAHCLRSDFLAELCFTAGSALRHRNRGALSIVIRGACLF